MPERSRKTKRPKDLNQLASTIVDEATSGKPTKKEDPPKKNPHAVALGRLGGLKGGKSRAKKLTKEQRSEIARKAAKSRWAKKS